MDGREAVTDTNGSLSTRHVTLAAGALSAYPHAALQKDVPLLGQGFRGFTYTVTGIPADFEDRVRRGEIMVNLRDLLTWANQLIEWNRLAKGRDEAGKSGGHA